jgi:hypothetical protein
MTATIRSAALVLAASLLIAGCGGGSASTGHTAQRPLSCQQQADRIQTLVVKSIQDAASGDDTAAIDDLVAARAFWSSMHKEHCPASSYAKVNRVLSGLGISL